MIVVACEIMKKFQLNDDDDCLVVYEDNHGFARDCANIVAIAWRICCQDKIEMELKGFVFKLHEEILKNSPPSSSRTIKKTLVIQLNTF